MFKTVLALALPLLALASPNPQFYGPGPAPVGGSSSTSSASAPPAAPSAPPNSAGFINVNVGFNGGYTFNPSNFTAPNGTVVTFFFPDGAIPHSVVQSSFDNPCTPLAATSSTPAGFDSGITQGTQWGINITDDSIPIWFFCKVPLHCGMGMVGSINAPTAGNNTYSAFQAAALAIGQSEPTVTATGNVNGGVGANATAAPTSSSATPTAGSGSSSGAGRVVASSGLGLLALVMAVAVML